MAAITNAVLYLMIKSILLRYFFVNHTALLFFLMISELKFGVSLIFSIREGIKKRATPSDTDRLIITTAAKSESVTFEVSSRKKITASAPIVVRVAARRDIPTLLFL